jgi:23S rRNA pseudouridine1911/1915/1917 synthase
MDNAQFLQVSQRILYRSCECIVVNKLKGEAVEGVSGDIVSLQEELRLFLGKDAELIEAVHRLDVPVTGCVLFALTKNASVFLNSAFAEKGLFPEKHYLAIVEKPKFKPPEEKQIYRELSSFIETNTRLNKSFAYNEDHPGRKKASLRYRVTGEGKNYLFLEIELFSGRHHQIRAQLASIGLYIKGDLKYGAKRSEKGGGIRLHARSLSFPDPVRKNEIIRVTADPPQMDNLWNDFLNLLKNRQFTEEFQNRIFP